MKNKLLNLLSKDFPYIKFELENVKRKTFDIIAKYDENKFPIIKVRDCWNGGPYWDVYVIQYHILPIGIVPRYAYAYANPGDELSNRYHLKMDDKNEMKKLIDDIYNQMLLFKIVEHWHTH